MDFGAISCMNSSYETLAAQFTVPNLHQRLTANRPVQVYTYVFDRLSDTDSDAGEQPCGTLYPYPGINALPPHDHEHYEIAIATQGSAIHQTSEGAFDVRRGDVLAVAPGEVHAFYRIDGLQLVNCTYLAEWLLHDVRELLDEEGLVPLFLHTALFSKAHRLQVPQWRVGEPVLQACVGEFRELAGERDRKEPSQMFMKWCLKKIMMRLHRAFAASAEHPKLLAFDPVVQNALERVEDHILQCAPFHVADLAAEMGMSANYFSKTFKRVTGWSPMDYFQRRRVQRACSLLLTTRQSATEIAHALGYCDGAHFSHLFKRYRGVSPREFRNAYAVD